MERAATCSLPSQQEPPEGHPGRQRVADRSRHAMNIVYHTSILQQSVVGALPLSCKACAYTAATKQLRAISALPMMVVKSAMFHACLTSNAIEMAERAPSETHSSACAPFSPPSAAHSTLEDKTTGVSAARAVQIRKQG